MSNADDVEALEKELKIRKRRLAKRKEQQAAYGIDTRPEISIEIEDTQATVETLQAQIAQYRYQRAQQIFRAEGLDLQPPPAAHGLILLVSAPSKVALTEHNSYRAIMYHHSTLQRCWLIATSESRIVAEELVAHCAPDGIECSLHEVKNAGDARETMQCVRTILDEIERAGHFSPDMLIADITGGTKPMSVGMALACGSVWPMQYMYYTAGFASSLPALQHRAEEAL